MAETLRGLALAGTPVGLAGLGPGLTQVPVVPDAETARRWAVTELSDPIYHERPNLLELFLDWLMEQLSGLESAASGMDPRLAAAVVVAVAVAGGLIALLVAGPVRRRRRARTSTAVFVDDARTAEELRSSADAHAQAGRWSLAVLDRFRAVLRSLEDRAVLDERPGRTAYEGAVEGADRLPDRTEDLHGAARLFDDVCYGHVEATAADDAWVREVDERVAATRPLAPAVQTEQVGV